MMSKEFLDKFITHLRVERGLSKNTWASYRRQILSYFCFLNDTGQDALTVGREAILEYLRQRKDGGLKGSSLYQETSFLNTLEKRKSIRILDTDDEI